MFAKFSQVTTPRATEDGGTWLRDTSNLTARITTPVQKVNQGLPPTGTDVGKRKNAQPVVWKDIMQGDAEPNRTMNYGAPGVTGTTTATTLAGYPPWHSSTPRYTEDYHPHPSPCSTDNHTVLPVEPNYSNRPSPIPVPNVTKNQDLSQLIRTSLNENREETKGIQQQKNLLANVPLFDGKDKKACLMWVNHVEHTA